MKRAACHQPGKNAVVDFDVDVNRRYRPNRKMEYKYLKQVLIPKVLPKLKILKNEKIIFPDFKLIVLFFWLTSKVDAHWCQRPVNVRQCCQHPFYCLFHHAPENKIVKIKFWKPRKSEKYFRCNLYYLIPIISYRRFNFYFSLESKMKLFRPLDCINVNIFFR